MRHLQLNPHRLYIYLGVFFISIGGIRFLISTSSPVWPWPGVTQMAMGVLFLMWQGFGPSKLKLHFGAWVLISASLFCFYYPGAGWEVAIGWIFWLGYFGVFLPRYWLAGYGLLGFGLSYFVLTQSEIYVVSLEPFYRQFLLLYLMGISWGLGDAAAWMIEEANQRQSQVKLRAQKLAKFFSEQVKSNLYAKLTESIRSIQHEINNPGAIIQLQVQLAEKKMSDNLPEAAQIIANAQKIKSLLSAAPLAHWEQMKDVPYPQVLERMREIQKSIDRSWQYSGVLWIYLISALGGLLLGILAYLKSQTFNITVTQLLIFTGVSALGAGYIRWSGRYLGPFIFMMVFGVAHLLGRAFMDGGVLGGAPIWIALLPFIVIICLAIENTIWIRALALLALLVTYLFPISATDYFYLSPARALNILMVGALVFGMLVIQWRRARRIEQSHYQIEDFLKTHFQNLHFEKEVESANLNRQLLKNEILPLSLNTQDLIHSLEGKQLPDIELSSLKEANQRIIGYCQASG